MQLWINIDEDSDQRMICEDQNSDKAMRLLSEWRRLDHNHSRAICITDETGQVLVSATN